MSALPRLCLALACVISSPTVAETPHLPQEVVINGVEFVLIPEGEFWYTVGGGNTDLNPGAPVFRDVRVWLDSYYIGKYEARIGDFERFLNTGVVTVPAPRVADQSGALESRLECSVETLPDGTYRRTEAFAAHPDLPATSLSWRLASGFAEWMGFRLPSEAEWEKAARGPNDQRLWPWGDEYPDDTFGHFRFPGTKCSPALVTAYPKGRSPYGLYNMAGNVAEWVADWYSAEFDRGLQDGVRNPPLSTPEERRGTPPKILKGGRWGAGAEHVSTPARIRAHPDYYFNAHDGVRFAVDTAVVLRHLQAGTAVVK